MKLILAIILSLSLTGCAGLPNRKEMVYVGTISHDCSSIRNEDGIATIPIGFKLTPTEAATSLPRKCVSKFSFSVYADTENYYFVDNQGFLLRARNARNIRKLAYVVNAHTGALTSEPDRPLKK